jgi:hypothetical protein
MVLNQEEIEQLKEIFRDVIKEEVAQIRDDYYNNYLDTNILPTNKAYKVLGFADARSLRQAIADGTLRLNKEYLDYRKEYRSKPNYRFNIKACQRRIAELSKQRNFNNL